MRRIYTHTHTQTVGRLQDLLLTKPVSEGEESGAGLVGPHLEVR